MGEILRAVLDESCTYSNPVFYPITIPSSADSTGNKVSLGSVLQLKQDRWFLQTGAFLISQYTIGTISGIPEYGGSFSVGDEEVDMYDTQSGRHYFSGPLALLNLGLVNYMPAALLNDNVTNFLTFPEYILWSPSSTVGVNLRGYGINARGQHNYTFMLVGIEYAK